MKQPSISTRIPSRASMDGAVESFSTLMRNRWTSSSPKSEGQRVRTPPPPTFAVRVATPKEDVVFEGAAAKLIFPGQIEILPGHAKGVMKLDDGAVQIGSESLVLTEAVAQIADGSVEIIAATAEKS